LKTIALLGLVISLKFFVFFLLFSHEILLDQ
jgi:hypothetical protein